MNRYSDNELLYFAFRVATSGRRLRSAARRVDALAVQFFCDGADAHYPRALDTLNDPNGWSGKLARGSEDKEHAISQQSNCAIAVMVIGTVSRS